MTNKFQSLIQIVLRLALAILILFPVFYATSIIGQGNNGVPPSYDGGYYYYPRVQEVADGYPFVGNPFFYEHRTDGPVAFFLADWINAIPILMGLTVGNAFAVMNILGLLATAVIGYVTAKRFSASKNISLLVALLLLVANYSALLRAVSMQLILPLFLLWLWSFKAMSDSPTDKKHMAIFLMSSVVASYAYTYAWQIIVVTLGVSLFFVWFYYPDTGKKHFFRSILYALFLQIPFLVYAVLQTRANDYWESMRRIGLVETHLLPKDFFILLSFCLIIGIMLFLARKYGAMESDKNFVFWVPVISALVITAGSNLVTGQELEIVSHVWRFFPSVLVFSMVATIPALIKLQRVKWLNWTLIFVSIMFLGNAVRNNFITVIENRTDFKRETEELQIMAPSLNWLNVRDNSPKVIWADSIMYADYVPIMTKNYVLFSNSGILHLVSDKEVRERYLVFKYFDNPNEVDVRNDLRLYGGVGYQFHQENVVKRRYLYCTMLNRVISINCQDTTTLVRERNNLVAKSMREDYVKNIVPRVETLLSKYHVAYIVKSKKNVGFRPELLSNTKLVYEDANFMIYER